MAQVSAGANNLASVISDNRSVQDSRRVDARESSSHHTTEEGVAANPMSATAATLIDRSLVDNQPSSNSGDPVMGRLYTCWFWATLGSCRHGRDCHLEHYNTGHLAPPDNNIHASEITCWFWYSANCRLPAFSCKFAHAMCAYLAQQKEARLSD